MKISDREAIIDLINRYSLAISHRKDRELKDYYAPGGVFDGLARFSIDDEFEEYVDFLTSMREGSYPNFRQFLAPSTVNLQGNTAEAFTPVMLLASETGQPTRLMGCGELHDHLVKSSSGWLFTRRTATVDGA